jgi:cysteinyl-tRNA synthetase
MKRIYKDIDGQLIFLLFIVISMISCGDDTELSLENVKKNTTVLNGVDVSTWMYQIQWLDERATIDELDNTQYDMLVVEPGFNFKEDQYDVNYLVSSLKEKPNGEERILLAYIDIGQAEDYRTYWEETWVAPTATEPGIPDFLVTIDPDGWSGNYPVAYWNPEWQEIWLGTNGLIAQIANYGFDGIYLDWVEAYDDDKVREVALAEGKNAENEMMLFIQKMRDLGKSINPNFLVVPQNAPYLLDANPTFYISIIDALATEDTWFYGEGDVEWNHSDAGDLSGGDRHGGDYSTANRIAQSKMYLALGIPVFTVDYCISEENGLQTYINSYDNGFIPLVTRVPLTNITEIPPSFD